ncbi:MAG: 6-carboxytetrahydropterin synthase QueD [Candidatus Latescibacterota bacterium]
MFEIAVEATFSAAHQLRGYQGSCSRLHGHNFGIRVSVTTDQLDAVGMGLDFRKLRAILEESTGRLDHQNLNEVPPFDVINPTSEHLARVLFEELKPKLACVRVTIRSVRVSESGTVAVTYEEDRP